MGDWWPTHSGHSVTDAKSDKNAHHKIRDSLTDKKDLNKKLHHIAQNYLKANVTIIWLLLNT